jgi:hypothetical protein
VIGRKSNVTPAIIFIVLLSLSRTRLSLWVTRLKDCVYINEISLACHLTCLFIKTLTSQAHQIDNVLHSPVQARDTERDGLEELFLVLEGSMRLFRNWEGMN